MPNKTPSRKKAQYQFALDSAQNIVDVEFMSVQNKPLYSPFNCIGCGAEMVAILKNEHQRKHFRHKPGQQCTQSYETYLHNLSKTRFYVLFKECLQKSEPFYITFKQSASCTFYKARTGLVCEKDDVLKKIDLTKYFDKVELEKNHSEFIPDVLLSSTSTDKVMYIEMAVTHFCEQTKIKSGISIVEFEIKEESDLSLFNRLISTESGSIKTYNFSDIKPKEISCGGNCENIFVSVNSLFTSGKIGRHNERYGDFLQGKSVRATTVYAEPGVPTKVNGAYFAESFTPFTRMLIKKNLDVKSCAACKFRRTRDFGYKTLKFFCKEFKTEVSLNHAIKCDKYQPIRSVSSFDWFVEKVKNF